MDALSAEGRRESGEYGKRDAVLEEGVVGEGHDKTSDDAKLQDNAKPKGTNGGVAD